MVVQFAHPDCSYYWLLPGFVHFTAIGVCVIDVHCVGFVHVVIVYVVIPMGSL